MIEVTLLKDSISDAGIRLSTFVLKYPRFIHSEVLTHRAFSRNASSSRAIPLKTQIEMLKQDIAFPEDWRYNQSGMQGFVSVTDEDIASSRKIWLEAALDAIKHAEKLGGLNIHKQTVNRLLEPFAHISVVLTGTDFDNFFALRTHETAQPEIQILSKLMYREYKNSQPQYLDPGSWHLPFIEPPKYNLQEFDKVIVDGKEYFINSTEVNIMRSVARCARVSYLKHDKTESTVEEDIKLYDRLLGTSPIHCYDDKTEILTQEGFINIKNVSNQSYIACVDKITGQFIGYNKPTHVINNKFSGQMYLWETEDCSLCVTDGHKLYAKQIKNKKDRIFDNNLSLIPANQKNSNKSRHKTAGESELRFVRSARLIHQAPSKEYFIGCIQGFFIGDGSVKNLKGDIIFHLKRERKIKYLQDLCKILNLEFSASNCNTFTVKDAASICDFSQFYNLEKEKTIPYGFENFGAERINGLFNGLKNSDGSLRGKTFIYSTTSNSLSNRVIEIGACFGYVCTTSTHISKNAKHKNLIAINISSKPWILINDSRKKDRRVQIYSVNNLNVYCVEIPGNVLITRRNNKIVLCGNCSPSEHQAMATNQPNLISGNFRGWIQYRKTLSNENITKYVPPN